MHTAHRHGPRAPHRAGALALVGMSEQERPDSHMDVKRSLTTSGNTVATDLGTNPEAAAACPVSNIRRVSPESRSMATYVSL